ITRNVILTNSHVVENARSVGISWGQSPVIPATKAIPHPNPQIDLALVFAEGFEPFPTPWLRPGPACAEIVVLGYPAVPQVQGRPLLRFVGTIASDEPVET